MKYMAIGLFTLVATLGFAQEPAKSPLASFLSQHAWYYFVPRHSQMLYIFITPNGDIQKYKVRVLNGQAEFDRMADLKPIELVSSDTVLVKCPGYDGMYRFVFEQNREQSRYKATGGQSRDGGQYLETRTYTPKNGSIRVYRDGTDYLVLTLESESPEFKFENGRPRFFASGQQHPYAWDYE